MLDKKVGVKIHNFVQKLPVSPPLHHPTSPLQTKTSKHTDLGGGLSMAGKLQTGSNYRICLACVFHRRQR